MLDELAYNIFE